MQTEEYLLAVEGKVLKPGALLCAKTELGNKSNVFPTLCFSHPEYLLVLLDTLPLCRTGFTAHQRDMERQGGTFLSACLFSFFFVHFCLC